MAKPSPCLDYFESLNGPIEAPVKRPGDLRWTSIWADRPAINRVWERLFKLRSEIAANADQPDYRAYAWQDRLRLEYSFDDCLRFHDAIEAVVVPAASRILERRRVSLQLDSLRPWDMQADRLGLPPLEPFSTAEELVDKGSNIFHSVDPELGGYFDTMNSEGLLDLDNRAGKAPGGYAEYFLNARRPFIFMNAVGTAGNVETLLHEGGHAFHVFEFAKLPYVQQMMIPSEFAEVASMSMELLSAPYLTAADGGFYSESEAARSRIKHLEGIVSFLALYGGGGRLSALGIYEWAAGRRPRCVRRAMGAAMGPVHAGHGLQRVGTGENDRLAPQAAHLSLSVLLY